MRSFRFDILGNNLRFFGPDGQMIAERPFQADEIQPLIEASEHGYETKTGNLAQLAKVSIAGWTAPPNAGWPRPVAANRGLRSILM